MGLAKRKKSGRRAGGRAGRLGKKRNRNGFGTVLLIGWNCGTEMFLEEVKNLQHRFQEKEKREYTLGRSGALMMFTMMKLMILWFSG